MPAVTQQSLLIQKLGNAFVQAHEKAKTVEAAKDTGGDLPAGIDGIAQLVDCRIMEIAAGKENAGKLMFFAAGVVVLPKLHEGIPIAGRRTSIMEPIYDTPTRSRKTVQEHINWVYSELKALGLTKLDSIPANMVDAAIEALKKSQPFFRFRTWKGPKQTTGQYAGQEPRVQHKWGGVVNFKTNEKPKPDVKITPPAEPEPEAQAPPPDEPDIPPEMVDSGDLDSLIQRAKDGNLEAQQSLNEQAQKLGIADDAIAATNTWDELGDLIKGKTGPTTDEEPNPDEAGETIGIGDQFNYKPVDKKTNKPVANPIKVEVTAIDEEKGTVTLKNIAKPTMMYLNVPMDQLEDVT